MQQKLLFCFLALAAAGCRTTHPWSVPLAPGPAVPPVPNPAGGAGSANPIQPPKRSPDAGTRVTEPPPGQTIREQVDIIDGMLRDAYFDYDQYRLRTDAMDALRDAARLLAKALEAEPSARLTVEGHCDERGSSAYNLALGEARAQKAREFLVEVGLPAPRIDTISHGEERPECADAVEDCWRRNRRAHLRYSNPAKQ